VGRPLRDPHPHHRGDQIRLTSVPLIGARLIDLEPITDHRGFFARTWCNQEFRLQGMNTTVAQCSISFNAQKGILRGLHYQEEPYQEAKYVRCYAGAIYDVIIDLRPTSPTYCKWFAIELSATNRTTIYVPEGFAHGFQTLADNTEVSYQISIGYRPEYARGIRWNDPLFGIDWPIRDPILSERDRSFRDYVP
jgi:dTDP-4-dehydrorhamnose 3,5-epimerase